MSGCLDQYASLHPNMTFDWKSILLTYAYFYFSCEYISNDANRPSNFDEPGF